MRYLFVFAVSILFSQQALAQEPGRTGGQERATSRDVPSSGASSTSSISTRGIAGTSETSTGSIPSRDSFSSGAFIGNTAGRNSGSFSPVPDLKSTSFYSMGSFYEYQDFLFRLRLRYQINSLYFQRFYINREPLLTPLLVKLALRDPLMLSGEMMTAVDELQVMLLAAQQGQAVNKQEIAEKTKLIRDLAKKIRRDDSLSFVDRRQDVDLTRGQKFEDLGLESIGQLREWVLGMHQDLKNMYSGTSTSTVSVETLSQPSFESLSKGIEKLAKVIESSARRL